MEEKYKTNKRALFIDIDGVLANIDHRLKYIQGDHKDYDKFYGAEMAKDEPITQMIEWVTELTRTSATVAFITGRPERTREVTKLWLKEHCLDLIVKSFHGNPSAPSVNIHMREDGDHRESSIVKSELVRNAYKFHLENWVYCPDTSVMILDDDPTNLIAMKKSLEELNDNVPTVYPMLVGLDRLDRLNGS